MVYLLQIHFLNKFYRLNAGNLLVQIGEYLLVKALLKIDKKVWLELSQHLYRLSILILKITQQRALLLILLLILIRRRLEIGQKSSELSLPLIEPYSQLFLKLLLLLLLLRLVKHLLDREIFSLEIYIMIIWRFLIQCLYFINMCIMFHHFY